MHLGRPPAFAGRGRNRHELVIAAMERQRQDGAVRTCVVVAFDRFQLLDLAGPVEVLRAATRLGAEPEYETLIATAGGRPVRSESGVVVGADVGMAELGRRRRPIDTLVVVGGQGARRLSEDRRFLAGL